jgi:hypothetical protein
MSSSWPPINTASVRHELGTIIYAMTSLGSKFPILGMSFARSLLCIDTDPRAAGIAAAKIQKEVAKL